MNPDFELYDGKTYSSLLQDIVKNHKSKQSRIKTLTDQLVSMVSEPGEAVIIVPLIKEYLEADIKNDDALVKLASILQKGNQANIDASQGGLSDKDLELLFSDIQKSTVEPLSETTIKELPFNN
jgi:hypothetical protein